MSTSKPRKKAAIAFARNFVVGIVDNLEPSWIQHQTNLTDEEMTLVHAELAQIKLRLEATVNQAELAKVNNEIGKNDE
jgi:hypothetical protein